MVTYISMWNGNANHHLQTGFLIHQRLKLTVKEGITYL